MFEARKTRGRLLIYVVVFPHAIPVRCVPAPRPPNAKENGACLLLRKHALGGRFNCSGYSSRGVYLLENPYARYTCMRRRQRRRGLCSVGDEADNLFLCVGVCPTPVSASTEPLQALFLTHLARPLIVLLTHHLLLPLFYLAIITVVIVGVAFIQFQLLHAFRIDLYRFFIH